MYEVIGIKLQNLNYNFLFQFAEKLVENLNDDEIILNLSSKRSTEYQKKSLANKIILLGG